jgi:hypothetical protein
VPEKGIRNRYSQAPFQLYMYDEYGVISTGSAFFYESDDDELFLVTNWHNLSGRHFISKKLISRDARSPTFIKAKLCSHIGYETSLPDGSFTTLAQRFEIYNEGVPMWFEHPILGSLCDVVALPMVRPKSCPPNMHVAANRISTVRIPVKPGCAVFILGFPRSISVGFGLPIWKSGYIASEPYYDVTIGGKISEIGGMNEGYTIPAFFIDSLTREGMSGSPIFAAFTGNWDTENPYKDIDPEDPSFWNSSSIALGEHRLEFVGCYSGRNGSEEEGAALGLCWRKDVIAQICTSKILAPDPHL